jgi:hypothetical protein
MEVPDVEPGVDPPPKKNTTRTLRREKRSEKNEYVIKVSLEKSLADLDNKQALMADLLRRVEAGSKAAHRLSMAVNLLIQDRLNRRNPFAFALPEFLNTKNATAGFQLIVGLDRATKPDADVQEFLNEYNAVLPPPPTRYQGDANTLVRAADQYFTNLRTYLQTTFYKRQVSYCRAWAAKHGIDTREVNVILRLINGFQIREAYEPTRKVAQLIAFHRQFLFQDEYSETARASEIWIQTHTTHVIQYFALLNKYLAQCEKKTFVLAPVASIRAHFIHIDTNVLHGMMRGLKLTSSTQKAFRDNQQQEWDAVFHTQKWLTTRQRTYATFTGTVQTDGVALCIHYLRPKREAATERTDDRKDSDRVIAVDPGRVTMFTGVEVLENERWKVYRLSRAKYYTESGILKARGKTECWTKNVQVELAYLSKYSPKGVSKRNFLKYLKAVRTHSDALWSEYLKRRWGRQRFALYSGKKSTLDRFLRSLNDGSGRRIVLAYGDAGFASTGPGEMSVPTTTLFRTCCRWYKTESVDEFRTSQIHWQTNERMAEVKLGNSNKTVRGLRWCGSTNKGKFVDRDVNAALNIRRCYLHPDARPVSLQRVTPTAEKPNNKKIRHSPSRASGHGRAEL